MRLSGRFLIEDIIVSKTIVSLYSIFQKVEGCNK